MCFPMQARVPAPKVSSLLSIRLLSLSLLLSHLSGLHSSASFPKVDLSLCVTYALIPAMVPP